MGFNLSEKIGSLNDAMYPGPNKLNNDRLGPFGGESTGFAKGVSDLYSKNFYTNSAVADSLTVAKGMSDTPIP